MNSGMMQRPLDGIGMGHLLMGLLSGEDVSFLGEEGGRRGSGGRVGWGWGRSGTGGNGDRRTAVSCFCHSC